MRKRSTLRITCLLLCALALLFVHTPPSLAAEGGPGWSFSDDGTLTLTRASGINDPPFDFRWSQVKSLRLGAAVESFLMCDPIPYLKLEKIWVNSQNPYFVVENGILIDLRENKVVCGEIGIVDAIIPDYVTEIGMGAFAARDNLQTVAFPEGLLNIMEDAFSCCTALQEIHFPDSLKLILGSFRECTRLTSVTIPAGVELNLAFDSCTSLKQATFAEGALNTGSSTFANCTALTDVYLPDSIRTIGRSAFRGCTSLETLRLPASLEKVEKRAFEGCTSLKMLDFPEYVKIAEDALPYELPTPTPIPTATIAPTLAALPETPSPDTTVEQGTFGKSQLLLIGIAVLIAVNVAAIVMVYKRKRR